MTVDELLQDPAFHDSAPDEQQRRFTAVALKDEAFKKKPKEQRNAIIDQLEAGTLPRPASPERTSNQRAATGDMGTLEAAGREALAVGSGIAGSAGDLVNTVGLIPYGIRRGAEKLGILPEVQPGGATLFHIPIGTEDINKATGFTPQTSAERIGQTVGGFLGPAAWLKAASKLGLAPEVVGTLKSLVSSGTTGDVLMGGAAGVGKEVGGPVAGAIAPVAVALGHGAVSRALPFAGRLSGALREQQVGARENALAAAQRGEEGVTQAALETRATEEAAVGSAQEEAGRNILEARREAQRTALAGEASVNTAQTEAAGLGTAQEGFVGAAEQAASTHFVPLEDALTQDVLKTRTSAGTPRAIPQTIPGTQEVGQAVQGEVATTQAAVPEQAASEGRKLIDSVGTDIGRMETLAKTRQYFKGFFDDGRKTIGKLFEATEAVTGEAPIFQPTKLQETAQKINSERSFTGQSTPPGTSTFALFSTDEAQEIMKNPDIRRLPSATQREFADILEKGAPPGEGIPFWAARRIESALNRIAYEGARPIGTIQQGAARRMLSALHEDFNNLFFEATPEGGQALTEIGSKIFPDLQAAKAQYADFIQTVNKTIVNKILDRDPVQRARFLQPFTSTNKSPETVEQILAVKENASPEVWNTLKGYTLGELYKDAQGPAGQFDPATMLSRLKAFRRSGKMDILFEPEEVASIERYAHGLTAADQGILPRFRGVLARKNPSEVVNFAFSPGKLENTQNFQAVTSPDTFDSAVKSWANQLLERLPTMKPAEIHKELGPLTYRDGNAPSQLDLMMTEYPGVADNITALVRGYQPRLAAVEAAKTAQATTAATSKEAIAAAKARAAAETQTAKTALQSTREAADQSVALAKDQAVGATQTAAGEVRSAKETTSWAREGLQAAKKEFGIPADVSVHDYMRIGGVHVRTGTAMGIGVAEVLNGLLYSHNPAHLVVGGTILVGAPLAKVFFNSPTGRRVIREGLAASYGPSAARWVAQSTGATPAESIPQ